MQFLCHSYFTNRRIHSVSQLTNKSSFIAKQLTGCHPSDTAYSTLWTMNAHFNSYHTNKLTNYQCFHSTWHLLPILESSRLQWSARVNATVLNMAHIDWLTESDWLTISEIRVSHGVKSFHFHVPMAWTKNVNYLWFIVLAVNCTVLALLLFSPLCNTHSVLNWYEIFGLV